MISRQEIITDKDFANLSQEKLINLNVLLLSINKFRSAYAKPMFITSGFRTHDDHIRIYRELAAKRHQPFDESKIPWGSQHLVCAAIDVYDKDGSLMKFCKANVKLLEECELWMEEEDDIPRCHFQIFPPKSGKRFFKP